MTLLLKWIVLFAITFFSFIKISLDGSENKSNIGAQEKANKEILNT